MIRVVTGAVLGALALGVLGAFVAYPSWELAVASTCATAAVPVAVVGIGKLLAPFHPDVPAWRYLTSAGVAALALALLAAAGSTLSTAPID